VGASPTPLLQLVKWEEVSVGASPTPPSTTRKVEEVSVGLPPHPLLQIITELARQIVQQGGAPVLTSRGQPGTLTVSCEVFDESS
jgi:hypothetical protein